MNAMDAAHYAALSSAWIRVRDDPDIRVAIVIGAGDKSFSAGPPPSRSSANRVADLMLTQKDLLLNPGLEVWKPVVAAVNGYCLGAGMMLLLGDTFDARTALRWDLVNRVVPLGDLMTTAWDFALRLAQNAPLAVQAAKELAIHSREVDLATGQRFEQLLLRILQDSDDVREGTAAFRERRALSIAGW